MFILALRLYIEQSVDVLSRSGITNSSRLLFIRLAMTSAIISALLFRSIGRMPSEPGLLFPLRLLSMFLTTAIFAFQDKLNLKRLIEY